MNKGLAATLERIALTGIMLCFLASGAGQLFGDRYPFELLVNFPLQYATVAVGGAALLYSVKRRLAAFVSGLFALVQLLMLLPFYLSSNAGGEPVARVRVMYANVFYANQRFDEVLALLREENPDILVLSEFTPRWAERMAALADRYPNQILMPAPDPFGIGVYSRLPLTQRSSSLTESTTPSIVATAVVEGRELTLIATHTLPPVRLRGFEARNQQLRGLAAESIRHPGHRLIIGDLNATPWSPYFRQLERTSGLQNARRGHGLAPTWPAKMLPWGIPIDHLLVSPDLQVDSLQALTIPGSDHRAIVSQLSIAR